MERTGNYLILARQAKKHFLEYDQERIIEKFDLPFDEAYLYPVLLGRQYRLSRRTGDLSFREGDSWQDGNSWEEVMTLLDLLCDSREDRHLSGRWQNMQNFGHQFHQNLVEDQLSPEAAYFDRHPEVLTARCQALHGTPIRGGDIAYAIELFDGLSIGLQFWHGDEEFAPRLRYLWDENALQYLRYETMFYAVDLLLRRLKDG